MLFIEHIKVQELPYFSQQPCLFFRGETWGSRIISHMPEIKQVEKW